ncbi:MAG: ATP-binding protein [Erysipelotrichaceae bacterium]|nr:ATP-binding protein [Erysipelotrichaceae bacterium]
MILEVRFENFRSMKKPTVFSLGAESICEFRNSIVKWNRNKTDEYRIVAMKLLYGQNSSGKSNLLLGIKILQEIIASGRIDQPFSVPYAQLVNAKGTDKPITLGISVVHDDKVIDYDICFDTKKVLKESLSVNRSVMFERKGNTLKMARTNKCVEYLDEQRVPSLEINEKQFKKYRCSDIFLTRGFKSFIAPTLGGKIQDYFEKRLFVAMDSAQALNHPLALRNEKEVSAFLKSVGMKECLDGSVPLAFGTQRFVNFVDLLYTAMKEGGTIVMDDLDASMDPNRMIPLLSMLHDPKINRNETQLVFSTFNPVYLNKYFIRRDEITFVSKEKDGTSLKTLIEYANRENNYMRKYLKGEYDTIAPLNFKTLYQR